MGLPAQASRESAETQIRVLIIYRPREMSYDQDWHDGFTSIGGVLNHHKNETGFHDLTVILHSLTAQWSGVPQWIVDQAERRGNKKLVLFLGNEFKHLDLKKQLAKDLNADVIATQLRKEDAERIYEHPVIEVPHALNPKVFFPRIGYRKRQFDIGVRGTSYPESLGDDDRNTIYGTKIWSGLTEDIKPGKHDFLPRGEWAKKLSTWRTMPSCEAGMVGAKASSSRHFDAVGSLTCLVMYPGHYNGIFTEEHYIKLERNHSNLLEVKEKIKDVDYCEGLVSRTREYLLDCHTHEHRARQVLEWASGTRY